MIVRIKQKHQPHHQQKAHIQQLNQLLKRSSVLENGLKIAPNKIQIKSRKKQQKSNKPNQFKNQSIINTQLKTWFYVKYTLQ